MVEKKYQNLILKNTRKRLLIDFIVRCISTIFALVGLLFLFWIIVTLILNGANGFSVDVFVKDSVFGGLRNAIIGHLILVSIASVIGIPVGILAGVYISEYLDINSTRAKFIRDISDIMMSAPSIIIGIFVYAVVVKNFGGYSGIAGSIALAIMIIPIVLKVTDDMLFLVPKTLREAAFALGAQKYKVIFNIVFRACKNGILTGIILAIARITGETAPLLFTSFHSDFLVFNPTNPMPSLTNTIFEFIQSPDSNNNSTAWVGAFVLALFILVVNVISRVLIKNKLNKG